MKNVYASNSDHLPDIAKFHLGEKIFIPSQVDKAELHIITANGTEIITFSKAALSFYLGTQHPFTKIATTSIDNFEKQIEDLHNKLQIHEQAAKQQNWTVVLPISTLSNGRGADILSTLPRTIKLLSRGSINIICFQLRGWCLSSFQFKTKAITR